MLYPISGEWAGKHFPVTSKPRNVEVTPGSEPGWQTVKFDLTKNYQCKFSKLGIYWVARDGVQSSVEWRPAITRAVNNDPTLPVGVNRIFIEVNTMLPPDRWHVHALHKCHPLLPDFKTILLP